MTQLNQAREFLAKVLPWPLEGDEQAFVNIHTRYQRVGYDKPAWGGRACRSLDEAVNALDWLRNWPDTRDIYVAMSTQRKARRRIGHKGCEYFTPIRNQANVVALKSLFLDIAVKGGAGYPRIEEAVDALGAFLKAAALPRPSIIVASGGGLDVYWTMCRALTPHEWQPLANALAEATKKHGLKCNTRVTVDSARILRVPDTFNRKSDPPRPVRLVGKRLDFDYSVESVEKALEPYKVATPRTNGFILDPALFPPRPPPQGESDLSAGIAQPKAPPIDLDAVASECAFIREALTTGGGAYTNPLWNLTTLISTFTEGGRADAHRMGNKHPGYTVASTDQFFDQKKRERDEKSLGWPSCQAISGSGCTHCQTCVHFQEGKSPLNFAHAQQLWQVDPVSLIPQQADSSNGADPLDFIMTTADDAVERINNEYFFRRDTSEICRQDAVGGQIQVLTQQQLNTALAGRWVEAVDPKTGKTKVREAASVWLESRRRREVHGVQYCPNNVGLRQLHLNLWLGWGLEPVPGECSIVLDHITRVVAGGDQQKAEFILNWCADVLQNPTRKPGVALVLRGPEGTGKSVLGAVLRRLLGERNVVVNADKDRLLGRFNSALAGKILIQAEESFFAGDSRTADALKHLITGPTLEIELKFGRNFEIASFHRLLITSNHSQVIQASSEARRFVVCDVSHARRGNADYFDRLYAVADGRDDATARAFMQHLINRDLSTFRPWEAQQQFLGDKALIQQKALSLSPPLAWLWEVLEGVEGEGPPGTNLGWHDGKPLERKWPTKVHRPVALEAFREWAANAKPHGASAYTGSEQRFWGEITRVIPRRLTAVKDAKGSRWVTITLNDLRACFGRYMQGEPNE